MGRREVNRVAGLLFAGTLIACVGLSLGGIFRHGDDSFYSRGDAMFFRFVAHNPFADGHARNAVIVIAAVVITLGAAYAARKYFVAGAALLYGLLAMVTGRATLFSAELIRVLSVPLVFAAICVVLALTDEASVRGGKRPSLTPPE